MPSEVACDLQPAVPTVGLDGDDTVKRPSDLMHEPSDTSLDRRTESPACKWLLIGVYSGNPLLASFSMAKKRRGQQQGLSWVKGRQPQKHPNKLGRAPD